MSFQLQAVVALVSARRERIDGSGEVHLAASNAQVDVAEHGIAEMHMPDSAIKAAYRIDLVITARHDVAEVKYGSDWRVPKCVVQHHGSLDVGAEPPRMRGLHEQVKSRGAEDIGGCDEGSRDRLNVPGQLGPRLGALSAARKHNRGCTDGSGQVNQGPQPALHLGSVQIRVIHVGDICIDQPDCHAAIEDLFRKRVDAIGGQRNRDVVADPR